MNAIDTLGGILQTRAARIKDMLRDEGEATTREQRHLDAGTHERLYWHYGYYMALQDILKMLPQEKDRN